MLAFPLLGLSATQPNRQVRVINGIVLQVCILERSGGCSEQRKRLQGQDLGDLRVRISSEKTLIRVGLRSDTVGAARFLATWLSGRD